MLNLSLLPLVSFKLSLVVASGEVGNLKTMDSLFLCFAVVFRGACLSSKLVKCTVIQIEVTSDIIY